VACTKAHLYAKRYLDPSSRLAAIDMGRKLGRGLRPLFWGGGLGPHLTQSRLEVWQTSNLWRLRLGEEKKEEEEEQTTA